MFAQDTDSSSPDSTDSASSDCCRQVLRTEWLMSASFLLAALSALAVHGTRYYRIVEGPGCHKNQNYPVTMNWG